MRFCPFCAQENPDDARECVHCGKRLPALRHAPAKPAPAAAKPLAPRPAPPRPAPRAPSLVTPVAAAATAAPAPSAPIPGPRPATPPPNGPAKAAPADATLKPVADADKAHGTAPKLPAVSTPGGPATRTLLGIPVQMPATRQPAAEADSPARTTKPLSLANIAKEAKRGPEFDEDAATQVHDGEPATLVDDGPTSPHRRVDEDLDYAKTTPRPTPPSRPRESLSTTPPKGTPVRRTPAAGTGTRPMSALAKPQPLSPSLVPTKPTALPPEPLPPAPKVSNDAGAFPRLDLGPTPAIPTLALPPMPDSPRSGSIVGSVQYLLPLAKAMWARKKAQDAIRTLLHGDQRLLDSVLRDLGRAAREEQVNTPAIADEMRRVKEQEERRAAADKQVSDTDAATKKEDERWHFDQGERQAELARREADVKIAEEDLRKAAEQRRVHEAARAKLEAQIRATEKRAAAADAKAAKADVTPSEKGGGPNTAANARAEAAQARTEATALMPARDDERAAVEKLVEPIATLTRQITDGRATLQQKRKELVEAKLAHDKALADLRVAREQAAAERSAADRELTQRFVTAGTILNLNRVDHPKLQPLFARIDELKNGVNAREAAIVRLESERRHYDRAAVQKGLLTVGVAAGTLILLAIILIVVMAR